MYRQIDKKVNIRTYNGKECVSKEFQQNAFCRTKYANFCAKRKINVDYERLKYL